MKADILLQVLYTDSTSKILNSENWGQAFKFHFAVVATSREESLATGLYQITTVPILGWNIIGNNGAVIYKL